MKKYPQSGNRNTRLKADRESQYEGAAQVAIAALSFIATEPDHLGRFLSLTGIGPQSLRAAATEPGFLVGVLDYVRGDEDLLVAFASGANIAPEDIRHARDVLANDRIVE